MKITQNEVLVIDPELRRELQAYDKKRKALHEKFMSASDQDLEAMSPEERAELETYGRQLGKQAADRAVAEIKKLEVKDDD